MTEQPEFFNFATDVYDRWATEQPESTALWWLNEELTEERRFTFAGLRDLSLSAARAFLPGGEGP